jgi:hypothetical protein
MSSPQLDACAASEIQLEIMLNELEKISREESRSHHAREMPKVTSFATWEFSCCFESSHFILHQAKETIVLGSSQKCLVNSQKGEVE